MSDDDSEKSHEPSQRKLDDARKKGELVRSSDIITASGYAGVLLALMMTGVSSIQGLGGVLAALIAQSGPLSQQMLESSAAPVATYLFQQVLVWLGPWFGLPFIMVVLSVFAQRAFVFAPTKLSPRLSRISLISNAKNKFGLGGLFEFLKSIFKLSIFGLCLGLFIYAKFPVIAETVQGEPAMLVSLMGTLAVQFLLIVVSVMAVFGGVDYLWQRHRHLQKHRMSHKELRDEHKEAEGDPHLKQERRARAQQVASHQMVAEVKASDVVIVNPTHYAVALKWSRKQGEAPVCVAKGVDEVALQIREIARDNGVPVHADPPTARALHARVPVGDQIHEEHFRAVAVAIRFAEEMRQKARSK